MAGRKCERCGGKSSPWIPRKRAGDGRLVCDGCAQAVAHERPADQPSGKADFWDGELAPEGHHPLVAPLPQSVWDRYHESLNTTAAEDSGFPNPHHLEEHGEDSPGAHEWYHGTASHYDGPPKGATELMKDHKFWGNFGAGDWNNHVGSHWTSLHQMAKEFNAGGAETDRVIHAKLHMKNPVHYDSLHHMAHDTYDRLHASGDLKDGGAFLGKHSDGSDEENHCCSPALLAYAKGGHRTDGKFGLERYRDSLRASGHDGIAVRNFADDPKGHWNAIPLSADQIHITKGSCARPHHDERDTDKDEFADDREYHLNGAEEHSPYTPGHSLPKGHEVDQANTSKKADVQPHVPSGHERGDSDPHTNGQDLDKLNEENEPEWDEHYCAHCDKMTDHSTEGHTREHLLRHLNHGHGFDEDHYLTGALHEMSDDELASHHEHEHATDFPTGDFPNHSHSAQEAHMASAGAMNKTAHDSGDGATIFHCPFCGSGQVIARSDRTTECEYCHTTFTVQVQPQFPAFPQTINGQPMQVPGMPGQIGGPPGVPPQDPMDPMGGDPMAQDGGGFPPGGEEGGGEQGPPNGAPDEEDDEEGGAPPPFAKGSMLRTASGAELHWDSYLKHLAIKFADDPDTVIERVRAEGTGR